MKHGASWLRALYYREITILAIAAVIVSALVLTPVALGKGWPQNHEGVASIHRMMAVTGQWEAGNIIPIWSSVQYAGMGSPMPGLYHKSFMLLSSAIYALTGGVKIAVVGALLIFSVIGFMGAALSTIVAFGRTYWPAGMVAGALLLGSNYVTTDWLIRGAFAEYSAVACVAALMIPLVYLVRTGIWSNWIGVCTGLIMISHIALALFTPLLVIIALAVAAGGHPIHWPSLIRRIGVSVLIACALAFPFL